MTASMTATTTVSFRRRALPFLLGAALLALAAWGVKAWVFTAAPEPGLITTPVRLGDIEDTVLATGTLQAYKMVSVGAQVSGQVKTLAVALGERVEEGQLVAEIDSVTQRNAVRNTEAQFVSAKAQLQAAQVTLKQATLTYQRQKQLHAADAISQADFETAQAGYESAQAAVNTARAQVTQAEIAADTARANLDYTRITSPMAGQVVAIVTEEGTTVNANQSTPTIIKVADVATMTVKAQISEADVPSVKAGQKVYFTILGEPDVRHAATLRAIEPGPDSLSDSASGASSSSSSGSSSGASSTAIYYNGLFDVPNPDGKLRISMTAQVNIVRGEARGVLTLPSAALGRRGADGWYTVRVVDAQGRSETRQVRAGLNNNVTAQIVDGLAEGDQVVLGDGALAGAASGLRRPPQGGLGGMSGGHRPGAR